MGGGEFEMKMKAEGGWGVGLNRWARVVERFIHLMFINVF